MRTIIFALCLALSAGAIGCSKDKDDKSGDAADEDKPKKTKLTLNLGSDADSTIKIKWIKIKGDKTVVKIKAKNKGEEESRYKAYPPGHDEAFFIRHGKKRKKKAKLTKVDGIELHPEWTRLKPGDELTFTLTFDEIDSSSKQIDLIEGKGGVVDENSWNWTDVDLK